MWGSPTRTPLQGSDVTLRMGNVSGCEKPFTCLTTHRSPKLNIVFAHELIDIALGCRVHFYSHPEGECMGDSPIANFFVVIFECLVVFHPLQ